MENNLRDVMMIDSLLDTESEQFESLQINGYVQYFIEWFLEDYNDVLEVLIKNPKITTGEVETRDSWEDVESYMDFINIPVKQTILDGLKYGKLNYLWKYMFNGGYDYKIDKWFNKYFFKLNSEKREQYELIYKTHIEEYMENKYIQSYIDDTEELRQQYLKQII